MVSKSSLQSAQNTVFSMIEPLIALGDLWVEGGHEISPGWREAAFDLKFGRIIPASKFIQSVAPVVEDEDRYAELIMTLLFGFLLDVTNGTHIREARSFIAASMEEMFELAAQLGMSKSEAEEFISGYTQSADAVLRSNGEIQ